jgi:hypothetical protein
MKRHYERNRDPSSDYHKSMAATINLRECV